MGVWTRRCCCGPGCLGDDPGGCGSNTCPESMVVDFPESIEITFTGYFARSWAARYNEAIDHCDPQTTGTCSSSDYYSLGAPELVGQEVTLTLNRDPSVTIDECTHTVGYGATELIDYPSDLFKAFSSNPLGAPTGTYGSTSTNWAYGSDATDFDAGDKQYWKVSAVLDYGSQTDGRKWESTSRLRFDITYSAFSTVSYLVSTETLIYKGTGALPQACYCGAPLDARDDMTLVSSQFSDRATAPSVDHTFSFTGYANASGETCTWCEQTGRGGCTSECTGSAVGSTTIAWNGYDSSVINNISNAEFQFQRGFYGPINVQPCGDSGTGVKLLARRGGPNDGYIDCDWAGVDLIANVASPFPAEGPHIALSDISVDWS